MTERCCTACGVVKPSTEFYGNGKNGLHTRCKQCAKEAERRRRLADPEESRRRDRIKHEKHREARLVKMREYHAANAQRRGEVERDRYEREADRMKAARKAYRDANPAKVRVWNGSRRAAERRATPSWADRDLMALFYRLAAVYAGLTGVPHHVDHVVPLKGKTVSGLHSHHNLRVVPASVNLRKGAKLDG